MADKKTQLSIVLRTVDRATAGINAINKRLDAVTKPVRDLGKGLSDLGEKSGLGKVADGFAGVGGAVKDLLGKVLAFGGAIAAAVVGVLSLVDEFDELGDKAEALGVGVDFLAQLRYAAERSGVEVSVLDDGLKKLSTGMGLARAGTGKLSAFLKTLPPVFQRQVMATKTNEEAFSLMADATAKFADPAKRAAFAMKVFGDASLAPLLGKGSKGIAELGKEFAASAGPQKAAADAAGLVDDAMKGLKAAVQGVKAAIVSGLGPALKVIVDQLKEWFVAHREDIAKWAEDIGKKLPGAVDDVVKAIKGALGTVTSFVDGIGGLKVVALVLAAVIVGPLIASIYSLSVALLTTPVGWILLAIAAVAAGAYFLITRWDAVSGFFVELWDTINAKFGWVVDVIMLALLPVIGLPLVIIKNWDGIKGFFVSLWADVTSVFWKAWDVIKEIVDNVVGAVTTVTDAISSVVDFVNPFSDDSAGGMTAPNVASQAVEALNAARTQAEARVSVDFANAPRGTRVAADPRSTATVDLSVGYQMGAAL